jgi:PAS domain S-box-containing protein
MVAGAAYLQGAAGADRALGPPRAAEARRSMSSGEHQLGGGVASVVDDVDEVFQRVAAPLALVDPVSIRMLAANREFADLLCVDTVRTPGVHLFTFLPEDQREGVEHLLCGIASGWVDSCQAHARWRLPNGEELDLLMWARPLDSARPSGGVLLATVPTGAGAPVEPATVAPDSARVALGTIDHDWRFTDIGPDAQEMFGWSLEQFRGTSLKAVVHPDDVPHLLLGLGRGTAERRGVLTRLRVRGHDHWVPVRCKVTPYCTHNPPRFAFAMWALGGGGAEGPGDRLSRLEDHLWRIALEVQAAGIPDLPAADTRWADPALRDLSQRQREILRRLLRGERVPAMARELFLSESTVRNHLSAIYRRLGVHSQQELLSHLLPAPDAERRAVDLTPE